MFISTMGKDLEILFSKSRDLLEHYDADYDCYEVYSMSRSSMGSVGRHMNCSLYDMIYTRDELDQAIVDAIEDGYCDLPIILGIAKKGFSESQCPFVMINYN